MFKNLYDKYKIRTILFQIVLSSFRNNNLFIILYTFRNSNCIIINTINQFLTIASFTFVFDNSSRTFTSITYRLKLLYKTKRLDSLYSKTSSHTRCTLLYIIKVLSTTSLTVITYFLFSNRNF